MNTYITSYLLIRNASVGHFLLVETKNKINLIVYLWDIISWLYDDCKTFLLLQYYLGLLDTEWKKWLCVETLLRLFRFYYLKRDFDFNSGCKSEFWMHGSVRNLNVVPPNAQFQVFQNFQAQIIYSMSRNFE